MAGNHLLLQRTWIESNSARCVFLVAGPWHLAPANGTAMLLHLRDLLDLIIYGTRTMSSNIYTVIVLCYN